MLIRDVSKRCHYCGGELLEAFSEEHCDWKEHAFLLKRFLVRKCGEASKLFSTARRLSIFYSLSLIGYRDFNKLNFNYLEMKCCMLSARISNKDRSKIKKIQKLGKNTITNFIFVKGVL